MTASITITKASKCSRKNKVKLVFFFLKNPLVYEVSTDTTDADAAATATSFTTTFSLNKTKGFSFIKQCLS